MQNKLISREQEINRLGKEIKNCKKCKLWETRNKPLVGDGSYDSEILFVGESPGYHEDIQGKAFVGRAGQVLDELLEVADIKRSNIYITNVLKCHPPRNHSPNRKQINACIGYLKRQIDIIKPKVIVTLGKYASREVFNIFDLEFSKISKLHGEKFETNASFGKIIFVPMFHPAVACYRSETLPVLKKDFQRLKSIISQKPKLK